MPQQSTETSRCVSQSRSLVPMYKQQLSWGYLDGVVLERALNELVGSQWKVHVRVCSRKIHACVLRLQQMVHGTHVLEVPRPLTASEIDKINVECRNHYQARFENVPIIEEEPSTAEPEQPESRKSVHHPSISDLPCFSHDSEMVLAINMFHPDLSGTIQILDNLGRTYVATRKTFQLWGDGLKNKLRDRVLFSDESKIEEGETAEVFGAVGKPTEDQVVKTVSNFITLSSFQ